MSAPILPGYQFERVLGSGGYSDVYLYRQQLPSRLVAIKVLKGLHGSALPEELRRQFTAEANAMAGLADHPNIVPVFSASVNADGRPYLVMQYYSRPNLMVRAASERLGVAEVLRVGIQIASAVETAHRAGILHRDIKPANLLINQYGTPGLTDFGIAGHMSELDDDEDTGVSVPWAAPEVLYATSPTSVRSDVYGLAATLWHLLVGRSPFEVRQGDNSAFALMRRVRDELPPPTHRPDVPESLDRLLRQAMSKDPVARPASAIEFARRLQSVEQELQLPRTEIVVGTDGGSAAPAPVDPSGPYSTAPSTVARPLNVNAQAPPTERPTYRPADPAAALDAPPTNLRPEPHRAQVPIRYSPDGGSVRAPGTLPMQPEHAETGRSRTPWLVAGAVVVIAGAVVAVVLSTGSGSPDGPRSTVSQSLTTQNAGLPGEDVPPGTPKVTGRRTAAGLVFTWTYSAPQADDTFAWQSSGARTSHGISAKPTVTLPASAGQTCLQVKVVRSDGSNASATFSPKGCI